jgi:hypothetical protein
MHIVEVSAKGAVLNKEIALMTPRTFIEYDAIESAVG